MLASGERDVVIFLDEVPILVNRILKGDDGLITPARRREADLFLSWLRDNSLRHRGKVRVVITGSIGLEPQFFVRRDLARLSTVILHSNSTPGIAKQRKDAFVRSPKANVSI